MSEAKREVDQLAGGRTPETVHKAAVEQLTQGTLEFWRMAFNPLSYLHPALVPLWLKWCPWLALIG